MERQQRPRLDGRLVFALVLVAIPVLYVVAHVILIRSGDECADVGQAEVGGLSQMFVPGDACETPRGR